MATPVIMPKFGMTMEEGTIVKWYKKEGDWVEKGETLLLVETQKLTMDVEAPASGVLSAIEAPEGTPVPIHQTLAFICDSEEQAEPEAVAPSRPVSAPSEQAPRAKPEGRIVATPMARRLAREAGIALEDIAAGGARGRISKADVEAYLARASQVEEAATAPAAKAPQAEAPAPVQPHVAPDGARVIPLQGMRKRIADRMAASAREIPHITLTVEVDMSKVEELRQQFDGVVASATGHRLSVTAVLVRAVAYALQQNPQLNATLRGEEIWLLPDINLGVAVALEGGLIVPVVHQAEKRHLLELDRLLSELAQKARAGKLAPDEVSGGTFTITNLGMYGVDEFEAIINPPEAAILAVGRVVKRPVFVGDEITVRPMMKMTLSADHRLLDGALAAKFLQDTRQVLESPYLLL